MQDTKSAKCKEDENIERQRRGSNSGKRQGVPAALRLMSPCDSDQELNDLEVASVLEGKILKENSCRYCTRVWKYEHVDNKNFTNLPSDVILLLLFAGKQQGNDCFSPTKLKRHETPVRVGRRVLHL